MNKPNPKSVEATLLHLGARRIRVVFSMMFLILLLLSSVGWHTRVDLALRLAIMWLFSGLCLRLRNPWRP